MSFCPVTNSLQRGNTYALSTIVTTVEDHSARLWEQLRLFIMLWLPRRCKPLRMEDQTTCKQTKSKQAARTSRWGNQHRREKGARAIELRTMETKLSAAPTMASDNQQLIIFLLCCLHSSEVAWIIVGKGTSKVQESLGYYIRVLPGPWRYHPRLSKEHNITHFAAWFGGCGGTGSVKFWVP